MEDKRFKLLAVILTERYSTSEDWFQPSTFATWNNRFPRSG
jgi:hypothetical protein